MLGVIIPTYNRAGTVADTLLSMCTYLRASMPVRFYVGCDGDDDTPRVVGDRLALLGQALTVLDTPSGSLGANLNRLIRQARADGCEYLLQLDDDHQMTAPVDLSAHIATLSQRKYGIGWVRLWGVGAHNYLANLVEDYWVVQWVSPEIYITSNRPHVKRADWMDTFGWYPEGVKLGLTEEGYCHQCRQIGINHPAAPRVAVPLEHTELGWTHTGQSWQLKGL